MSDKLAISSALSVMLMATYVLFGGDARQMGLRPSASMTPTVSAPALLPDVKVLFSR